ncbi:cysteine methyltransferase [Chryseobacterium sp. P1-3]|uniref:methylated-DNA--[protein]-cysteine S-methyltransferase n=1 Tax=Chryseobacterium gallinarum TaxID=1324352 RepID=A0A0G3M0X4_CHRGL|nr:MULTISPECIES: methylated-DNA--[protein]-cysteine S-methyltransferase [Chryseobacterium]AKK71638.1 cysteine methyltransferase [Chryseobacterium gallinarum]KFF75400.1 cysteine methyltransferase [Chryseobacterium sp. P1-3]
MSTQNQIDYNRIAKAIEYIRSNFRLQPSLEEVAENIHLSPAHFQKIFTDWAGTSPKKFLQFISLEHAKNLLKEEKASIFDTAYETGLSSTSRLHDLFVKIEGMSPAEYKNGGKSLSIHYSFSESPFGTLLVASTEKGICYMAFEDDKNRALGNLKGKFPNASFSEKQDALQQNALSIFNKDWTKLNTIKLHLKGTDFQLKVWESLLKIPMGKLSTYGNLAEKIGSPKASRAVGTAIGSNPVAFLIPCHRVIQSTGHLGGYRWGNDRKQMIVGWESSQVYS